jgi:hypothetical protein
MEKADVLIGKNKRINPELKESDPGPSPLHPTLSGEKALQ